MGELRPVRLAVQGAADEVTSALDAATAVAVLDLLDGLRRTGLAVLAVTHDRAVAACADRTLRLAGRALHGEPDRTELTHVH
jgi:peptide/nickel transport system ATP-binding protein